jgi:uncharacterized protein (TIGR02271 family)
MKNTDGTPIETLTEQEIPQLRNIPVYAGDEEIGHVGDIYYDETTEQVQCVGVKGGMLGFRRQWVPAQGAVLQGDGLYLSYGRDAFEGAPGVDDDDTDLDADRYQQVHDHFVRHEEELAVGKERVDAGSVRLKKWVEEEAVDLNVDLKKETARVTREPIDQPVDGADFEEAEVEMPLHREQAHVEKQVVAKERVGVTKDVETERQHVGDTVRKERIEVEDETR